MTTQYFAVPASITPRHGIQHEIGQARIVRIAWLAMRLVRRDVFRFEDYRARFGASVRTFRRDIAALRDAGVYVDAKMARTEWCASVPNPKRREERR